MGYNPTYGGQFQGLRASAQKTSGTAKAGAGAGAKAGGGGSPSIASQGSGGQGSGSASGDPGEKVVVTLGGLKKGTTRMTSFVRVPFHDAPFTCACVLRQVHLESLNEGDELFFIVVGLFEGDDLNTVVNRTRNRTKPVKAQAVGGNYMCAFAGEKLVLPIPDPSKRFILYICAVTIKNGADEQGKTFKDISLMGIGFSEPYEVTVCKKYHHSTAELRLVDGGDPSIKPGKLEVAIDVCKTDSGPSVPADKEE
ncbi:hypothetical protein Emag_000506 [Eimeria magna]